MYNLYTATIELTRKCNAKCKHCIIDAGKQKKDELTTERIIKLLEELHDEGCKVIILTGGEPFLRKDWCLIAEKSRMLGLQIIMMTNGLAIDDKLIRKIKLYNISLGISLDGCNSETHDKIRGVKGIFKHFTEIVPKLIENQIYVSVPTTVMKCNYNQLDDILELLIKLKVPTWQLQVVKPASRLQDTELLSEEEYYNLAKKIVFYRKTYSDKLNVIEADCIGYNSVLESDMYLQDWHGCECGIFSVSIESDGNVKGCPNMNNSEGNITNIPFSEIWRSHDSFKYNRSPSISKLKGYCKKCEHKYTCRGGCPTNARTNKNNSYCLYKIETVGADS